MLHGLLHARREWRAATALALVAGWALATTCQAGDEAASTSVADAVAIATDLARADGRAGQAALADRADRLARIPAECVVPCLAAFGEATPGGANWLRSGLDRAADRVGESLGTEELVGVITEPAQPAKARMLAFAWLMSRDAARADGLLDTMLDDPVLDLRREAVEKLLASTSSHAEESASQSVHRRALAAARDIDQIERIAQWLTEHGDRVNLAEVLGFVRRWKVSGTFDNAQGVGFATVHPPETGGAATPDTSGWRDVTSADRLGVIDLNAVVGASKGVLAYAVADVEMPQAGAAEVRIGSPCAVKVWVNGVPVMAHEIYHASEAVDQYTASADFRAGVNTILVKCCQNEQTESWAADWKFQLRVCDRLGTPLATQPERKAP